MSIVSHTKVLQTSTVCFQLSKFYENTKTNKRLSFISLPDLVSTDHMLGKELKGYISMWIL